MSAPDELPGMMQLAVNVRKQVWPHTMDAKVWAEQFAAQYAKTPEMATDEGWMLSWFANAIMAGYDTACTRADAPKADSALADELGRLILESCRCADESLSENDGNLADFAIKHHDEIDAALRAQPGGAVPREPTEEMLLAVDRLNVPVAPPEYLTDAYCERWRQQFRNGAIEHWRVMWDAATKADAREDDADRQPVEGRT